MKHFYETLTAAASPDRRVRLYSLDADQPFTGSLVLSARLSAPF